MLMHRAGEDIPTDTHLWLASDLPQVERDHCSNRFQQIFFETEKNDAAEQFFQDSRMVVPWFIYISINIYIYIHIYIYI